MKPNFPKQPIKPNKPKDVLVIQLSTSRAVWLASIVLVFLTMIFFLGLWAGSSNTSQSQAAQQDGYAIPMDQYQSPPSNHATQAEADINQIDPNYPISQNPQEQSVQIIPSPPNGNENPSEALPTPPNGESRTEIPSSAEERLTTEADPIQHYLSTHAIPRYGPYVIRVATHNSEQSAQDTSDFLTHKGYPMRVKPVTFSTGKTVYQIETQRSYNTSKEVIRVLLTMIDELNVPGIEDSRIIQKK